MSRVFTLLLMFACSDKEIREYLELASFEYALRRYLEPLIKAGLLRMTIPDKPRSRKQTYVTTDE